MNREEQKILVWFLKYGLSTRKLDELLGLPKSKTKGWPSWKVIDKYNLKSDKGKLFLYSSTEIKRMIKEGKELNINELIRTHPPNIIEKYRDAYVIARSEERFHNILSGEVRNTTQIFFKSNKKLVGKCQFKDCNYTGELDTVHLSKARPKIFINCAKEHKEDLNDGFFKFEVYNTMECFLRGHSKSKSICFLCKEHHNALHKKEKQGKKELKEFKRGIHL